MSAPVQNNNGSLLASGIGALGSVGSSFLSGILNYASMAKQNEYAKDLMRYQWENFASPRAQAQAMAAAGINPAVAFGQGGSGFTATPSPTMPSSSPPSMAGMMDIAGFVKAMAEAKKAGLESTAQEMQNQITSATMADAIKAVGLKNSWTESEITKIDQEVSKMTGELNLMHTQAELNQKQIEWFDKVQTAEINKLKASAAYENAMAGLSGSQKKLLDDTLEDLKKYANYNQQYLEKMVALLDKYGDAQAIVGMISQVVSSASDFIGNFVTPTKVTKVIKDATK